jgi:hypothetical protein
LCAVRIDPGIIETAIRGCKASVGGEEDVFAGWIKDRIGIVVIAAGGLVGFVLIKAVQT